MYVNTEALKTTNLVCSDYEVIVYITKNSLKDIVRPQFYFSLMEHISKIAPGEVLPFTLMRLEIFLVMMLL